MMGTGVDGAPQEVQLGGGQLGRSVGHEDQRVGDRQERQCGRRVRRVEPADPRSVDEGDPALEQRMRDEDLHLLDGQTVVRVAPLRDPPGEVPWSDRLGDRDALLAAMDHGARSAAMADDGDRHRRQVVVDRTDVGPEQAVDQRALALLELADDADHGLGRLQRALAIFRRSARSLRPAPARTSANPAATCAAATAGFAGVAGAAGSVTGRNCEWSQGFTPPRRPRRLSTRSPAWPELSAGNPPMSRGRAPRGRCEPGDGLRSRPCPRGPGLQFGIGFVRRLIH